MIVTEADLRDQLRVPTVGAEVVVPAGARLSPSAADFVKQWCLVTVDAATGPSPGLDEAGSASWDKASVFPLDFEGQTPTCTSCGMAVTAKASSLTQLNAHHFASKTHPRIKLRGRVDSLHATTLLIQRMALQAGEEALARDLGTVAAYCRELTSAEYNERPVAPLQLQTWNLDDIHRATHDPKGVLGIGHLTIDGTDHELQHWLNLARTAAREIEILALETFPSPHHAYGESICHAFNRLSSIFYFLQLRLKVGAE